jgi:hypothetical protein
MPTSPLPLPASPQTASLNVPQAFAEALRCHEQGRLPEAERLYEAILAVRADHFDALQMLARNTLNAPSIGIGPPSG